MRCIPKIISGLDSASTASIWRLYHPVFDTMVRVSRPEVAELTKLYENCQPMINIAFANEMADACAPHGIGPFEVARAAATKPFGVHALLAVGRRRRALHPRESLLSPVE